MAIEAAGHGGNGGGEGGAWIVEAARCGYMGGVMVEGLH
jgi:hypothetical protein